MRKRMETANWNDTNYAHQMVHFKALDAAAEEQGNPQKHTNEVIFTKALTAVQSGNGRT